MFAPGPRRSHPLVIALSWPIALLLAALSAQPAAAQVAPGAMAPPGPTVLSRNNLAVTGTLAPGAGQSFTVNYQPQLETGSKPSPWLLRMYLSPPNPTPDACAFTWLDQTDPNATAATTSSQGKSSTPSIGGNAADVPVGTDTNSIEQAMLSGGGNGTFLINASNNSPNTVTYTMRLFPLIGGVVEPGTNPNPTPVSVNATPTPAPAAAPQPGAPAPPAAPAPPPQPAFTPFWVKTLIPNAQLYSGPTSPPAASFGGLPQFSCLKVAAPPSGSRFYVVNPATGNFAYVNVGDVGGLAPNDRSCG